MTDRDPFDLEEMFERARATPPAMPRDLTLRILADAAAAQPRLARWRRAMLAVGGPMGIGGLVAATLAGAWIGVAPPAAGLDPLSLLDGVGALAQDQDMTGLYGFGWDTEEG